MVCAIFAAAMSAMFDGEPLHVEEARHSAFPMNQTWPGYERPLSQSRVDGFVRLDLDSPGELAVALPEGCKVDDVKLRPYSLDVLRVSNGVARFMVKRPGRFVLEFGERHPALFVFADRPFRYEHVPNEIYFGPGVHDAGLIEPKNGQTVCIDAGAIVYGALYLSNVTNVTVTGRGILDGSRIRRTSGDGRYLRGLTLEDKAAMRDVTLFTCLWSKNVEVREIVLRDSPFWTMLMRNSVGIGIDGVKIVGQWRYNSDGMDICGCEDVRVRNSFVRSFDDSFVVRDGGLAWGKIPVSSRNIVCENSMLWSDWGWNFKAQIGGSRDALIESVSITNCVFANVDSGGVILAARPGGKNGAVRDIRVEDVEYDFAPRRYAHQWQKREVVDDEFVPRQIYGARLFEICNYGYKAEEVKNVELFLDRIEFRHIRAAGPYSRLDAVVRIAAGKNGLTNLVVDDVPPRVYWQIH